MDLSEIHRKCRELHQLQVIQFWGGPEGTLKNPGGVPENPESGRNPGKKTQKVMDGSCWNFQEMSGMAKTTSCWILGVIRKKFSILDHFESFLGEAAARNAWRRSALSECFSSYLFVHSEIIFNIFICTWIIILFFCFFVFFFYIFLFYFS